MIGEKHTAIGKQTEGNNDSSEFQERKETKSVHFSRIVDFGVLSVFFFFLFWLSLVFFLFLNQEFENAIPGSGYPPTITWFHILTSDWWSCAAEMLFPHKTEGVHRSRGIGAASHHRNPNRGGKEMKRGNRTPGKRAKRTKCESRVQRKRGLKYFLRKGSV